MARLKETYKSEVAPALMKKFNYKSVMQIPKLDKVIINIGCGEARDNSKVIDETTLNQKPSANEGVYDRLWEVNYN